MEQTEIHLKVNKEDKDTFVKKCNDEYGVKWTNMMRDIIKAFNDGRVTIKPADKHQNLLKKVYEAK